MLDSLINAHYHDAIIELLLFVNLTHAGAEYVINRNTI
jgi:hypothetical protein